MTHSGGQPHTNIGDKGQRYEISVLDDSTNERIVLGWTDKYYQAMKMRDGAITRPSWSDGKILDRQADKGGE